MPMTRPLCALLSLGSLLSIGHAPVQAQRPGIVPQVVTAPHLVGVGDPMRKAILNALRPTIEKDLGQPIRFVVEKVRHQQGWAFVIAHPQTPAGRAINFARTHHAERQAAGILDGDTIYALLRRDGGTWSVRDFVIGPTDVTYAGWPDEYGAPATLFGLPQ